MSICTVGLGNLGNLFTCPHTFKFRPHLLASTASDTASDSSWLETAGLCVCMHLQVWVCVRNCATFYRKPSHPFIYLPCYISQYQTCSGCDLPCRFLHATDLRVICAQSPSQVFSLISERWLWPHLTLHGALETQFIGHLNLLFVLVCCCCSFVFFGGVLFVFCCFVVVVVCFFVFFCVFLWGFFWGGVNTMIYVDFSFYKYLTTAAINLLLMPL